MVFTIVKLGGAAYLIFLGVQAIRHRQKLAEMLGSRIETKSVARVMADGFVVGIGNPKAIVFFAAVLPQFVDRPAGQVPQQMLLLGAIFAGIALLSDSGWALVAGSARAWFGRSPRRLDESRRDWGPGDDRNRRDARGIRAERLTVRGRGWGAWRAGGLCDRWGGNSPAGLTRWMGRGGGAYSRAAVTGLTRGRR